MFRAGVDGRLRLRRLILVRQIDDGRKRSVVLPDATFGRAAFVNVDAFILAFIMKRAFPAERISVATGPAADNKVAYFQRILTDHGCGAGMRLFFFLVVSRGRRLNAACNTS